MILKRWKSVWFDTITNLRWQLDSNQMILKIFPLNDVWCLLNKILPMPALEKWCHPLQTTGLLQMQWDKGVIIQKRCLVHQDRENTLIARYNWENQSIMESKAKIFTQNLQWNSIMTIYLKNQEINTWNDEVN